ncbi:MAG: tRNA pseudouridine(38-40) synthase TruA [Bacteroidales bacterium]|jgi:tRNA pseudouridine38-40 synthase|nr:tRNA pseudouridine(38-40) synthase TruA [Bacteroidales bacterium]
MRYKIELSYNGRDFHGWQKQPNAASVQQTIEEAISLIFKDKIDLTGCGRTDTGVHAKQYIAHFDSEFEYNSKHTEKLNRYLPDSISIFSIKETYPDFHARFDAKSRTYEYVIATEKNPFTIGFSWYIPWELDINLMKEAADKLYNYNDFTSFSKLHTDVKTNNCRIIDVKFIEEKGRILFMITADRFLRNMVRAIVGTLTDVGKKKINVNDFCKIIENKDRGFAGKSAPAEGLFLLNIEY